MEQTQSSVPTLMPHQLSPFNGDTFIEREISKLAATYQIDVAIETGTCLGGTTAFLASRFNKVVSMEINAEWAELAREFVNNAKHEHPLSSSVDIQVGSSTELLPLALRKERRAGMFIFLDAHWGKECPLEAELNAIIDAGVTPVLAIHDFQVPGHPELGYDCFPDGRPFSIGVIKPYLDKIYGADKYHLWYNDSENVTDVKRGVLFAAPMYDAQGHYVDLAPYGVFKRQAPLHRIVKPMVNLYSEYYYEKNDVRREELHRTILLNYDNEELDNYSLVCENAHALESLKKFLRDNNIPIIYVEGDSLIMSKDRRLKAMVLNGGNRTTYLSFFTMIDAMTQLGGNARDINIIANLDIFVTPSVVKHLKNVMRPDLCLALSPWDEIGKDQYRQKRLTADGRLVDRIDSQDAWVVMGDVGRALTANADFPLGKPGCDNAIAHALQEAGYTVVNPSNDIRLVHIHQSNVRNYNTTEVGKGENTDRIPGPYKLLPPCGIKDIPAPSKPVYWPDEIHSLPQNKGEMYSQFNEEVIIQKVFDNIKPREKTFVDIGGGAYEGATMSNTRRLFENGWKGFSFDAAAPDGDPYIIREYVTDKNIVGLIRENAERGGVRFDEGNPVIDFLNLDIDGFDFYVLKAILEAGIRPNLICAEFNGTLDPNVPLVADLPEGYLWDNTNYYGFSFAAGKMLLQRHGYRIIYAQHDTNLFAVPGSLLPGWYEPKINVKKGPYHRINPNGKWKHVINDNLL